jgi:hypothetical protein
MAQEARNAPQSVRGTYLLHTTRGGCHALACQDIVASVSWYDLRITTTPDDTGTERVFRLYEAVSGPRAYSFASQVPVHGAPWSEGPGAPC